MRYDEARSLLAEAELTRGDVADRLRSSARQIFDELGVRTQSD